MTTNLELQRAKNHQLLTEVIACKWCSLPRVLELRFCGIHAFFLCKNVACPLLFCGLPDPRTHVRKDPWAPKRNGIFSTT